MPCMPIDTSTQLCAVIGNPVEHSLSPAIHNAAFQAAGLNFVYVAFRVEDVAGCLAGMRALEGFRGMSVTIPHKLAVMPHLDEIDPLAQRVGSVNTIVKEQGRLIGSTTDGPGTLRAFRDAHVPLEGKRVLFLGAGGAVRAVAFAMAEQSGASQVTLLGRSPQKVKALKRDLEATSPVPVFSGSLETDLERAVAEHDVLIQGTPTGMHPASTQETLVPQAWLRPELVVFDMVYRPLETRLLLEARETGCQTIGGIEMLLNQAVLQFETWTGIAAPYPAMRQAVLSRDQ